MMQITAFFLFLLSCITCVEKASCFTSSSLKSIQIQRYVQSSSLNPSYESSPYLIQSRLTKSKSYQEASSSSSSLVVLNMKKVNDEIIDRNADPTGLKRGLVLFPLVVLVAIWLFTIPPEFRRARICTEQQVIDNPGSRCITAKNWVGGVQEYYSNGGGIKFDFTIDPED